MRRPELMAVLLALAASLPACSAQPDKAKVHRGGHAVTPTSQPDSKSIVLRSTHILLIDVISANAGPWADSQPGLKARNLDLSVRVAEVLRGKLDPPPGGPMHISVTQSDYAGELMMQPLPGPWPRGDMMPGTALVVFAGTRELRAETVLVEPACTQVMPAEPVLAGLRIAAQAEAGDLPLSRALALAAPEAAHLDPIFADFLWGKYGGAAMASQSEFDSLEDFAERPGMDVRTRQALLKDGYDLVGLHGDSTPERARRLALAMFRVLLMDEAADLRENLIGTYLPNLLGITSDLPHQEASKVFQGHEAERKTVEAFLRRQTDADATPLLTWINAR